MIHAVYDCMIFVQAAARPSRVHTTMQLVKAGRVALLVTPAILEEVSDVLTRPAVQAKFPELRPIAVAAFLDELLKLATVVNHVPQLFKLPRDPKDEPYINLSIASRPCTLVTWNQRHLTYLMRRDTPEGIEFCQRFPDVTITDPPGFIRSVNLQLE